MIESKQLDFVRRMQRISDLYDVTKGKTFADFVRLGRKFNFNFDAAMAEINPIVETDIDRYWRERNSQPFYSLVETEFHRQDITCPCCDKTFYCMGFGPTG